MSEEMEQDVKIQFKTRKRKNLRPRRQSDGDNEDDVQTAEETSAKLEETKLLQKLREKPNGVNVIGLAIGQKVTPEDVIAKDDPYKTKSGGMINMQNLKKGKVNQVEDPYDVGIGTQFSAETNKRDEDEEMMKYIEEQLTKRKQGKRESDSNAEEAPYADDRYLSPEEAALLALPDHLRAGSAQRSEEMLSNQMLSGIPEVDLGIEAKIKNIEATEEAKERLVQEQKNKKDGPSHFVPTNMAVNFVQHNRFNIEEAEMKRRKLQGQQQRQREGGQQNEKGVKKATDDYHYDKFKKQFRRY